MTDASEDGFGATVRFWDMQDVTEVGRAPERSRFKRPPRSFSQGPFFKTPPKNDFDDGVESSGDCPGPDCDQAGPSFDIDPDFREVLHELLVARNGGPSWQALGDTTTRASIPWNPRPSS